MNHIPIHYPWIFPHPAAAHPKKEAEYKLILDPPSL